MRPIAFFTLLCCLILPLIVFAEGTSAETIEGYLKQLGIDKYKRQSNEFQFTLGFPGARPEQFMIKVLPEQKVVYLAILNVYRLPTEPVRQQAVLRAMAELNYKFLIGKLELNPENGEIRFSHTFANENTLDFATFKAVIQTLLVSIENVRAALQKAT